MRFHEPGIMSPLPYPCNREECAQIVYALWNQYLSDNDPNTLAKYRNYKKLLDTKYAEPWGA